MRAIYPFQYARAKSTPTTKTHSPILIKLLFTNFSICRIATRPRRRCASARQPSHSFDFAPARRLAEREGFEPPSGFHLKRFSRPPQSTTLPPLRPQVSGVGCQVFVFRCT